MAVVAAVRTIAAGLGDRAASRAYGAVGVGGAAQCDDAGAGVGVAPGVAAGRRCPPCRWSSSFHQGREWKPSASSSGCRCRQPRSICRSCRRSQPDCCRLRCPNRTRPCRRRRRPAVLEQQPSDLASGLPRLRLDADVFQVGFRRRPLGLEDAQVLELPALERLLGEAVRLLGVGEDRSVIAFLPLPRGGVAAESRRQAAAQVVLDPPHLLEGPAHIGLGRENVALVAVPERDRKADLKVPAIVFLTMRLTRASRASSLYCIRQPSALV